MEAVVVGMSLDIRLLVWPCALMFQNLCQYYWKAQITDIESLDKVIELEQ